MSVIARYLVRLFLARFLLVIAGLSVMAEMLDVIANADDILETEGAGPFSLFRYAGLRLPEIIAEMIPLSVLLGVMLTYVSLIRHNEMPALKTAGISQFRQIAILLPVAAVIAGGQFWLQDRIVPRTIQALHDWGVGDYGGGAAGGEGGPAAWIHEGDSVVRARWIRSDGNRMEGVTIFRRNGEGNLIERTDARAAERTDGAWTLSGVSRLALPRNEIARSDEAAWDARLPARLLSSLSKDPKQLSVAELARFRGEPEFGNRPAYAYETWLQQKLSIPVGSLLMVLLAVPLAQLARRGGIAPMLVAGVAIGFLYLVFDGLALSLGGAGLLPPFLAAWVPALLLASVGGALALHCERR